MDNKDILFKPQEELLKGTQLLSDVVGMTIGPRGLAAAIDRGFDTWVITDGVNTARQVQLENKVQNLGVRILREAAIRTVDESGDGTSATIVLGHAIFAECYKMMSAGINPMSLRKGLEDNSKLLIKELARVSQPVSSLEQTIQVASVSAEDTDLGELIAVTYEKIGKDGILTVEESKTSETTVDYQEGMQFDSGYLSPYFVTDPNRMVSTIEDAYVFITDYALTAMQPMTPMLEKIASVTRNVVFISPEVGGSVLPSMIATRINGGMNVLCINAPIMGSMQKEFLQDMAVLTGGRLISEGAGMKLEDVTPEDFGRARRVTSTKSSTEIVGGKGLKDVIKERAKSLKEQLKGTNLSDYEREKIKERIAKLSNGVAVLKVGGQTEVEMKERRERALDAVAATKAALEEGIVPGGEITYLHLRKILDTDDFAAKILYNALEQPFKRLIQNAGYDAGNLLAKLEAVKDYGHGFDVTDGKLKHMFKKGIVDPAKVIRNTIENSVSVGIQLSSIGATIIPIEKGGKDAGKNN